MNKEDFSKIIESSICGGLVKAYCWIVIPIALVVFTAGYFSDRDSTDSEDERSGMSIHIDNLTGCHYLYKSSLTPRLSNGGIHYGCKK